MFEKLLVGLIVAVAAGYAAWALLPAFTRRRLALRAAQALGGADAPGTAGRLAAMLQRLADARGGCDDCPAHRLTPAERAAGKDSESRNR